MKSNHLALTRGNKLVQTMQFPNTQTTVINSPLPLSINSLAHQTALWSGVAQSILAIYGNEHWIQLMKSDSSDKGKFLSEWLKILLPFTSDSCIDSNTPNISLESLTKAGKKFIMDFFFKNTDTVLRYLLSLLGLAYTSNYELRKHIKDINAKYLFKFNDRESTVTLEIRTGRIRVIPTAIDSPNVTLTFSDATALKNLLGDANPDVLAAILAQDIIVEGNLTYLYKLAFLVKHFQSKIIGLSNQG